MPPIVSHLDIHKAYIIHFYHQDKMALKVKVKDNAIHYQNHYYALSHDFSSSMGSIDVALMGH
jgi:hypothetical protein